MVKKQHCITLDSDGLKELDSEAHRRGMSRSAYVNGVLLDHLNGLGPQGQALVLNRRQVLDEARKRR